MSNNTNTFDFAFTNRGDIHYAAGGAHIVRTFCDIDLVAEQKQEAGVEIDSDAIIWQKNPWLGGDSITWFSATSEILLEDEYINQAMLA
jgi:hypothetical protein